MDSVARKIDVKAVFQEFGEIVAVDGKILTVRGALGDTLARQATSCLVEPSLGDRVLVAAEERGDAFVLAVLEQRSPEVTTIAVEGDLQLRAARGKVTVAAQEGIELLTAAAVSVASRALEVSAAEAISVIGGAVKAEVDKVKLYATAVDGFYERWSQRVKRSYRTVEELDQVKARHIDYAAQGTVQLRGETTLVSAHDLVKLNAEQIHVG